MTTFDREKFIQLRKLRKITIDDAALKAEVHRVTLSGWERGVRTPSEKNIRALAHALGVPVGKFSDLQEEEVSGVHLSDMVKSWLIFADSNDNKRDEQQSFFINYLMKQYTEFKQASLVIKAILSTMQSVFYVKDTELKYITANNAFRKNFLLNPGYRVLGKTDEDFFAVKEAKKNTDLDQKVLYSGKPIIKLEGYIPGSRKKKRGMISKLPIFDADGKIAGIVSFFDDMTNEFKAEENRKILEATLAESSDVVWLVSFSPQKKIIFVSDSVETLYGYPKEKFEEDYDFWLNNCVHPDDKDSLVDYKYPDDMKSWAAKLTESGLSSELNQYRIIDAKGNMKWVEESMFRKTYQDIDCMCFIERDITERIVAEENRRLLEASVNNSSDVLWLITFTPEEQKLIFVSESVKELCGYSKDFFFERSNNWLNNCIHPDDREEQEQYHLLSSSIYQKVMSNETLDCNKIYDSNPYRIIRSDGEIRWVEERALFYKFFGKKCFVYINRDITERHQVKIIHELMTELFDKSEYYNIWLLKLTPLPDKSYFQKQYLYTSGNRVTEERYGYNKDAFAKDPMLWHKLLLPMDKERIETEIRDEQYPKILRYRIVKPDGDVRWLEDYLISVSKDNIIYFLGISRDLTSELSDDTREFQQLSDMLKGLTAESSDIFWIKAFNLHYLFLEGSVEEVLMLPKKALLEDSNILMERIHPDDIVSVNSIYSNDVFPVTLEYRVKKIKSGYISIKETVFKNDKYYYGIIRCPAKSV